VYLEKKNKQTVVLIHEDRLENRKTQITHAFSSGTMKQIPNVWQEEWTGKMSGERDQIDCVHNLLPGINFPRKIWKILNLTRTRTLQ